MGGRGSLDVAPVADSATHQHHHAQANGNSSKHAAQQQQQQQHAATAEVLAQPGLQPFLQQDFNAAEFTSHVLAASRTSAQAQAEQLKAGVRQLEHALSAHVISNHHELLQHARKLADTEHSLQDVVLSVSSLQASVKRIRAEMEGPYVQVKAKTTQLTNMHTTIELLRHLGHRLKLVAKLRQQLEAAPQLLDLAKAAKLLTDINTVSREVDFGGVAAAEADEAFLQQAGAHIHDQAQAFLIDGLESQSQAKVGSALQVFFNLEELNKEVDAVLSQHIHELERTFKLSLDSRHLSTMAAAAAAAAAAGGSSGSGSSGAHGGPGHHHGSSGGPGGARGLTIPAPGAAGSWQDKLWSCLRSACDALATSALSIWHLQRVVAKKRDPISHVLFLDVVCPPGTSLLTERFWSEALRVLSEVFAAAARPSKGGFVRDALTSSYPRLVTLLESTVNRIITDSRIKGVAPAMLPEQLPLLLDVSAPFRDAYLTGGLVRLQEAVGTAFPGGSRALPSPADVQKCIGLMHEELKSSGSSGYLASLVGGSVGKALRMLAEKAEYMAAAGPELRQVSLGPAAGGGASQAQLRNIALFSQLQEVHRSLSTLLPRLPGPAAAALAPHLDALQNTAIDIVAPIFKAAMDVFEGLIMSMQQQSWGQPIMLPPPLGQGAAAGDDGSAAQAPAEGSAGGGGVSGSTAAGGTAAAAAGGGGGMMETSEYVTELANAIAVFRAEYLSKFIPAPSPSVPSVCSTLVERAAGRLLMLWVRSACLLRPLGGEGKLQLAKDLGELQMVVGQGLFPLDALGPAHRCLRALRALLFTEDSGLSTAACLQDMPAGLVLLHCFSRLPAPIQTPAERSGLSPAQFSRWLDQHTTADVARGVANALQAAKADVAAAEAASEGQRDVLALMKALCGMA